jgi:hypothetical protein
MTCLRLLAIGLVCLWLSSISKGSDKHYKRFGIEASDCFEVDPNAGSLSTTACEASAVSKMTNGKVVRFHLLCNKRWATCMQLEVGQVYEFEEVPDKQYRECGPVSEIKSCLKIVARPYGLIYQAFVVMAEQPK